MVSNWQNLLSAEMRTNRSRLQNCTSASNCVSPKTPREVIGYLGAISDNIMGTTTALSRRQISLIFQAPMLQKSGCMSTISLFSVLNYVAIYSQISFFLQTFFGCHKKEQHQSLVIPLCGKYLLYCPLGSILVPPHDFSVPLWIKIGYGNDTHK